MDETIVAISTGLTNSGIGIIRMSGKNAFKILDKIFIPKNKNKEIIGYTMKYGLMRYWFHILLLLRVIQERICAKLIHMVELWWKGQFWNCA